MLFILSLLRLLNYSLVLFYELLLNGFEGCSNAGIVPIPIYLYHKSADKVRVDAFLNRQLALKHGFGNCNYPVRRLLGEFCRRPECGKMDVTLPVVKVYVGIKSDSLEKSVEDAKNLGESAVRMLGLE